MQKKRFAEYVILSHTWYTLLANANYMLNFNGFWLLQKRLLLCSNIFHSIFVMVVAMWFCRQAYRRPRQSAKLSALWDWDAPRRFLWHYDSDIGWLPCRLKVRYAHIPVSGEVKEPKFWEFWFNGRRHMSSPSLGMIRIIQYSCGSISSTESTDGGIKLGS